MPNFGDVEKLVDLYLSELPEGVYPEDRADNPDPDKRSSSSAEIRAMATLIAECYVNLLSVYDDKFITTVTLDGLRSWEKMLFSEAQDSMLPYATRQQKLFSKLRASGGISRLVITSIVDGILTPQGLAFQISPWCDGGSLGAWILDESALDEGTYLGMGDPLIGAGGPFPLDCDLDYAAAGLTLDELLAIQATAYTYDVRIFGVADAPTFTLLDQVLTDFEPARSTHVIQNNFPGPLPP